MSHAEPNPGFLICPEYIPSIFDLSKKSEYRNFRIIKHLNQLVEVLSQGKSYGIIKFTECNEINQEYRYAWKIQVIKKHLQPKEYDHPAGCQLWVKAVNFFCSVNP